MCEFCKDILDNKDAFFVEHNVGILGNLSCIVGIDEDKSLYVNIALSEKDNDNNLLAVDVLKEKIKFCPMCGRKLED